LQQFRTEHAARWALDTVVGVSPAIKRVRQQLDLATTSGAHVVFVGERGTGRQHLARALHYGLEPSAAGPLVPLSCALLDRELLESTFDAMGRVGMLTDQAVSKRATVLLLGVDRTPQELQG